jgi:hypothetical protein
MTSESKSRAWYYCRLTGARGVRAFRFDVPGNDKGITRTLVDLWYSTRGPGDTVEKLVLDLPFDALDVDLLVIRGPLPPGVVVDGEMLREYLEFRTSRKVGIAQLHFPEDGMDLVGGRLEILASPKREVPGTLLQSLRELEFRAQLEWSNAVLTPPFAHFELPAGTHADTFIRVTDCFSDTAFVSRVSDWISHLIGSNNIIIGDTWTILPLLQELAFRSERRSGEKTDILTFQSYPFVSHLEQLLARVPERIIKEREATVIFVISVVSTGSLLSGFREFAPRVLGDTTRIEVIPLVDTREEPDKNAFVHLPAVKRFHVPHGTVCELCRDTEKRPVVRIDPRTYSPIIEGTVKSQMLRHDVARVHREFWEVASRQNAVRVHRDDNSTGERRHLPVAFDISKLLGDKQFRRSVIGKLRKHSPLCDLVVVPDHPMAACLVDLARVAYHKPKVALLPRSGATPGGYQDEAQRVAETQRILERKLRGVEHIVILDDVVIHGRSIRAIHRLLQDTISRLTRLGPVTAYQIHAFVVLGRPATKTRWERLLASLQQSNEGVHLAAAELLFLSDDPNRCPWCEELGILRRVMGELTYPNSRERILSATDLHEADVRGVTDLIEKRISYLQPAAHERESGIDASLFLCRSDGTIAPAEAEQISPHSLFGEGLIEPVAYAAVATALQEIRNARSTGSGTRYSWEVPKVLTAYHDPLLSASFLRAAFQEEIAVNESGREFNDALAEISFASPHSGYRQSPILVAELEWAIASEKLPPAFSERVREKLQPVIDQIGDPLRAFLAVVSEVFAPGERSR